jgi:hypothetical protein
MLIWLLGGYAVMTATLVCYATHIALSKEDGQHRADAYRVLKLIWTTIGCSTGLFGILLKLHDLHLL